MMAFRLSAVLILTALLEGIAGGELETQIKNKVSGYESEASKYSRQLEEAKKDLRDGFFQLYKPIIGWNEGVDIGDEAFLAKMDDCHRKYYKLMRKYVYDALETCTPDGLYSDAQISIERIKKLAENMENSVKSCDGAGEREKCTREKLTEAEEEFQKFSGVVVSSFDSVTKFKDFCLTNAKVKAQNQKEFLDGELNGCTNVNNN